jgi:hypothetical protein
MFVSARFFDELLEDILDTRSGERMVYQKITEKSFAFDLSIIYITH